MRRTPHTKRHLSAALLAAVLVAGMAACGSDHEPGTATDPATDPASESTGSTGATGATAVTIISATAAGGSVNPTAQPINTAAERIDFIAQFRTPPMANQVKKQLAAQADAADAANTYAAVISIGCDVPPGADVVTQADGTYQVTPHKVPKPLPECLAPVTSIAVVTVS